MHALILVLAQTSWKSCHPCWQRSGVSCSKPPNQQMRELLCDLSTKSKLKGLECWAKLSASSTFGSGLLERFADLCVTEVPKSDAVSVETCNGQRGKESGHLPGASSVLFSYIFLLADFIILTLIDQNEARMSLVSGCQVIRLALRVTSWG